MHSKNQILINTSTVTVVLLACLGSYITIYLLNDFRSQIIYYLLALVPAYLGYFIFVYMSLKFKDTSSKNIYLIIIFGIIFRVVLMPSTPFLSDDIFRYLWDGKVFASGLNPFAYAPNAAALNHIKDTSVFPFINFPEIPTVYPPVAQLFFAFTYLVGYKVLAWKLILSIFEIILILFLLKLIKHFAMNKMRLAIYFLNPIVIIESYGSGHLDVIAVCFLIIGIYYFYKNKTFASIFAFILAILIKYKPIFMILPFLKRRFFLKLSTVLMSIILVLIPFWSKDIIPTAGIISYANRWEFNGFIYKIFVWIFDIFGSDSQKWFSFAYNGRIEDFYISSALWYKLGAFIAILVIIIDQFKKLEMTENFKGANFLQASFFVCGAMLLLSPTLYPWYLIWLIPLLIFIPNWSWILFTALIQMSYYVLQDYHIAGQWEESKIILLLQYLPFYGLLVFEYLDKRKIKGWFI